MKAGQRLGHFIDHAIEAVSPTRALKRQQARAKLQMLSAYRGAERGRLREGWIPPQDSADAALLADLPTLRKRSRDLNRNDGLASGITSTIVTNTVGTGLNPQSRPDAEGLGITDEQGESFANNTERNWKRWTKEADAGNRMHFNELTALVERQILENGEVLLLPVRANDPNRFLPLAFEVIEADRLQTPTGQVSNRTIRSGVELGDRGQPIAYWINPHHPGDTALGRSAPTSSKDFIRYPAMNDRTGEPNILHLYWTKRPRQTRGEPFFSSVLTHFKDLSDYMEAELVAARIQACFALIFESEDPYSSGQGNATGTDAGGNRLEEIEPGTVHYASQGEKAHMIQPTRPGNTFDAFVDKIVRMIGASLGLPYELVMKDFSKTNYSSARAALLEARRFFKNRQVWLASRLCDPLWTMVQREAWIAGHLPGVNLFQDTAAMWLNVKWIAPGWGWVDPVKEVKASLEAINGGLSTLAEECAAIGGKDWQDTARQAKREQKFYEDEQIKGGPYVEEQPNVAENAGGGTEEPEPSEPGEEPDEDPDEEPTPTFSKDSPRFLFSDAKGNGSLVGTGGK